MPGVAAVEDGERFGDVEVEPIVGREGPEIEKEVVGHGGYCQYQGSAEDDFASEEE